MVSPRSSEPPSQSTPYRDQTAVASDFASKIRMQTSEVVSHRRARQYEQRCHRPNDQRRAYQWSRETGRHTKHDSAAIDGDSRNGSEVQRKPKAGCARRELRT